MSRKKFNIPLYELYEINQQVNKRDFFNYFCRIKIINRMCFFNLTLRVYVSKNVRKMGCALLLKQASKRF